MKKMDFQFFKINRVADDKDTNLIVWNLYTHREFYTLMYTSSL